MHFFLLCRLRARRRGFTNFKVEEKGFMFENKNQTCILEAEGCFYIRACWVGWVSLLMVVEFFQSKATMCNALESWLRYVF
ncbi:hypothetical protein AHAS_Ahas11G0192800 [Arachis hypogaea]